MALTADFITNEEIIKTYEEAAEDITLEAGDSTFSGHDAIEALEKVLVACVIYANEYEKNPFKKEK